jgi:HK97 family phage portal protein
MQRAGVPVTAHTSLQIDTVYTALRVLSNMVIKMGSPRAYTVGVDDANRHYRKWEYPNAPLLDDTFGNMFQFDGMARTVVSMGLFGEAFWYTLMRDNSGYASALEVLHPAFIKIEVAGPQEVQQYGVPLGSPMYWYGNGINRKMLALENVTHIPFLSMPGAMRGLNSLEYAGVAYALALAAMEYGQRWFSQGASPSFLLSTDQKLGREEVERIAQKFLVEHSGLQSAHLPLVVDSGLQVQKMSSTPDEAQYLNTLEYARSCIAAWFGLPAHLVGGTDDKGGVWGKTVMEQGIQLVDFTLSGYIVRIEEAFSSLLPKGVRAKLDESSIVRSDGLVQAQRILALRTATVSTINDIRVEELKLPPIEGGDDISAPLASNTAPGATTPIAQAENAGSTTDTGPAPTPPPAVGPAPPTATTGDTNAN